MNEKSTLTEKICDLKPKPQTIKTILAFATAYQVERLSNGELIQYLLN